MNKSSLIRSALLLAAGIFLLSFTASAAESVTAAPKNPDGTTKIPAEILLAEIKATPYADRAVLREKLKTAESRFADKLPEWEARKNNLPEKERKAAEADFAKLVRQRELLRQKIDGVESAGPETWRSAKNDLYSVLQTTIRSHKKLQARFAP